MNKVIITDYLHPHLQEQLTAMGFDVDVFADITNERLAEVIADYTGLVVSTKIMVTPQLIDRAKKLTFIARAGSGMENIDMVYAASKGIQIVNSPEANANAVGEHALGILLAMLNNICKADREIRNGIWQREPNRGEELDGKSVGIIGFGNTGSAFARKLAGFDVDIYAYDKYKSGYAGGRVREVRLEELQQMCDVISFHVPHTAETHHYLNTQFLENCSKQIWIVNTSRGRVVDTAGLLEGLASGKVKGAALDVFENERFGDLPATDKFYMEQLSALPQVVMTPHVAGWSKASFYKISAVLADKIRSLKL